MGHGMMKRDGSGCGCKKKKEKEREDDDDDLSEKIVEKILGDD